MDTVGWHSRGAEISFLISFEIFFLFCTTFENLRPLLNPLARINNTQKAGLITSRRVNAIQEAHIRIEGQVLEEMDEFTLLGNIASKTGGAQAWGRKS